MVITIDEASGIKCQAGEFVLLVDAPPKKKGNLILTTKAKMPVDTFGQPEVIFGPGEYEVSGVRVRGIGLASQSTEKEIRTIYTAELDDMRMAFLLDLKTELEEEQIDKMGEIDILFLSLEQGGLKSKQITSLIKQLEPSVVIAASDKTAKILSEELGQKIKAEEKFVVKKKDLVKEGVTNKLIWLKTK